MWSRSKRKFVNNFHGTFVPESESSRERKFQAIERSLLGAKVPRSESFSPKQSARSSWALLKR